MYRLSMKNGSIVFLTIEDLMLYVVGKCNKLFIDGAFIKIYYIDDFCEDFLVEDLKK